MMCIIIYMISILAAHLDDIQKIGEFRPLLIGAKGEDVPVNELKFALIRAIEIMLRELDPTLEPGLVKVLNSAKLTLENTLNDII